MSVIKPFYMNDNSVLINLSTNACRDSVEILNSKGFKELLKRFTSSFDNNSKRDIHKVICNIETIHELIEFFKLMLVMTFEEALISKPEFSKYKLFRKELITFVEDLYDFWREFERYGIIQRQYLDVDADNIVLVNMTTDFWRLNLSLYRNILGRLLNKPVRVYRQTPGGFNAGFIVSPSKSKLPKGYEILQDIDVINSVMIRTPFIGHSKSNKRSGVFQEIYTNPISNLRLTKRHWLCFPIKVGEQLAFVYFHRTFLHHGISLSNLFEPAIEEYFEGKKPNLIYVYGSHEIENDKTFYIDKENDVYVGYVSRLDENDYFGYMKKMLLTLHNVYMIKHNMLPIHGAMVNIVLNNDKETNIVIIGDSGAGKSETLEALRFIANKKVKEMNIIFDDMGYFYERNGQIYAKGTEIGAFVRLDDLDTGYAYKELDRGIFLNPERNNARVIIPNSTYNFITQEHKIDYIFYANNYEDNKEPLRYLDTMEAALDVFRLGKRKAKGTTSESGLVTSFFANPFGPLQFKDETEVLIKSMFSRLFDSDIKVGELYTKLSIVGMENTGVYKAAKAIFKIL